jgi:hypothetical protein
MTTRKLKTICMPAVTLQTCKLAYIIHNNQVLPLATCPSNLFREAIHGLAGDKWDDDACLLLQAPQIDLVSRWYIVNLLAEKGKPVKIYKSLAARSIS